MPNKPTPPAEVGPHGQLEKPAPTTMVQVHGLSQYAPRSRGGFRLGSFLVLVHSQMTADGPLHTADFERRYGDDHSMTRFDLKALEELQRASKAAVAMVGWAAGDVSEDQVRATFADVGLTSELHNDR